MLQLGLDVLGGLQTAVDDDGQGRKVALELVDDVVAQGWNLAVLLRAQALKPGVSCVDDEDLAAAPQGHRTDEIPHEVVALFAVDPDAMLDGDGQIHRIAHGGHTVGHQIGLGHETSSERAALHTLTGATAVQIHLVVAPALRQLGALRQIGWFAAAQLQGDRMLDGVEIQMPCLIAMDQCARRHHLGVKPRPASDQPMEVAAMAVRPIEHRRDTQAPRT